MELTPRQRAHLKGLAHHLKPVVHLGKEGLTEAVEKQIVLALEAHELIKVRVTESSPLDRHQASEAVPPKVGAFLVQNIGKVLVLYRPHPEKPRISLPWPAEEPVSTIVAEARRPIARTAGSLLRSVREGEADPVPPPRAPTPKPRPPRSHSQADPAPRGKPRPKAAPKRTPRRKPVAKRGSARRR
jgi:RNA-binding protein